MARCVAIRSVMCRALLTAVAISCTLQVLAQDQGTQRLEKIKDLICVLLLSGVQKEDLDMNILQKLKRHDVNYDDLNNENFRKECILKKSLKLTNITIDNISEDNSTMSNMIDDIESTINASVTLASNLSTDTVTYKAETKEGTVKTTQQETTVPSTTATLYETTTKVSINAVTTDDKQIQEAFIKFWKMYSDQNVTKKEQVATTAKIIDIKDFTPKDSHQVIDMFKKISEHLMATKPRKTIEEILSRHKDQKSSQDVSTLMEKEDKGFNYYYNIQPEIFNKINQVYTTPSTVEKHLIKPKIIKQHIDTETSIDKSEKDPLHSNLDYIMNFIKSHNFKEKTENIDSFPRSKKPILQIPEIINKEPISVQAKSYNNVGQPKIENIMGFGRPISRAANNKYFNDHTYISRERESPRDPVPIVEMNPEKMFPAIYMYRNNKDHVHSRDFENSLEYNNNRRVFHPPIPNPLHKNRVTTPPVYQINDYPADMKVAPLIIHPPKLDNKNGMFRYPPIPNKILRSRMTPSMAVGVVEVNIHPNSQREAMRNASLQYINHIISLSDNLRRSDNEMSKTNLSHHENQLITTTEKLKPTVANEVVIASKPNDSIIKPATNGTGYNTSRMLEEFPNKTQNFPPNLIKEIAENIKTMVLKDLRQEIMNTTPPNLNTTIPAIVKDTLKTELESTKLLKQIMNMFKKMQNGEITTEKPIDMTSTKHTDDALSMKQGYLPSLLPAKAITPSNLNSPKALATTPQANPYTYVQTEPPAQTEITLAQWVLTVPKNGPRPTAITIQTNSMEIEPLIVPLRHPKTFNQNIIVPTQDPFEKLEQKSKMWELHHYGPNRNSRERNRGHYWHSEAPTTFDSFSPKSTSHYTSKYTTNRNRKKKLSLNDKYTAYSNLYKGISKHKYNMSPIARLQKPSLLESSVLLEQSDRPPSRYRYYSRENNMYDNIEERLDDRLDRFEDRMEDSDLIESRHLIPLSNIKRVTNKHDDSHFKNFLKTQQKVNEMLERILSTKTSNRPRSVEYA